MYMSYLIKQIRQQVLLDNNMNIFKLYKAETPIVKVVHIYCIIYLKVTVY